MIEIRLNGKLHQLAEQSSVVGMLSSIGFAGRPVLVEVNQQALLATEHATTILHAGDQVEVIQIVAGG